MATWRVAESLEVLRRQLNEMAPARSKASDGSIGDQAHAARKSDHNPDAGRVVRARDYTHDPAHGLDCNWLAQALIASGDRRIKYIIWNKRIWQNGSWSSSSGHTQHLHLSVVAGAAGDSAVSWNLGGRAVVEEDFLMGMHQRDQELLVKAANRVMGMLQQTYWKPIPNSTKIEVVGAGTPGAIPSGVLDTVAGNYLVNQVWEQRALLQRLEAEIKLMRGETVDQAELDATLQREFDEFVAEWREAAKAGAEIEDEEVKK